MMAPSDTRSPSGDPPAEAPMPVDPKRDKPPDEDPQIADPAVQPVSPEEPAPNNPLEEPDPFDDGNFPV